jgi:hypothetical protein
MVGDMDVNVFLYFTIRIGKQSVPFNSQKY